MGEKMRRGRRQKRTDERSRGAKEGKDESESRK